MPIPAELRLFEREPREPDSKSHSLWQKLCTSESFGTAKHCSHHVPLSELWGNVYKLTTQLRCKYYLGLRHVCSKNNVATCQLWRNTESATSKSSCSKAGFASQRCSPTVLSEAMRKDTVEVNLHFLFLTFLIKEKLQSTKKSKAYT